jgi:hypothetical protein
MSYIIEVYKIFRATGPATSFTTQDFHKRYGKKLRIDLKKAGNATSILDRAGLLESEKSRPRTYKLKANCKDVEAQARISALWKKDGTASNGTGKTRRTRAEMELSISFMVASGRKVSLTMRDAIHLQVQLNKLLP